jgi:tetratricopeptide (TPR) repeat protein
VKVIDVHPEELLDRELRGVLSDEQRALLDAHLTNCEGCRLERLLRADFAAEAARAGEADMQSFVLGALQRAASAEVVGSDAIAHGAAAGPDVASTVSSSEPRALTRRRLSALLAVACVLLVAAGAAASRAGWVERMFKVTFGEATLESPPARSKYVAKQRAIELPAQHESASALAQQTSAPVEPAAPAANPTERTQPAVEVPTAALAQPESLPARVVLAQPRPARSLTSTYRPAARTARIRNVGSGKAGVSALAAAKAPAPSPAPLAASETKPSAGLEPKTELLAPDPAQVAWQAAATSLFEQGNRARRSGRLDQAATLYESLQIEFKGSAEAKLSYALSARMWLDAGNAFAAYSAFERYLATGDRALREEAMTGRALSLERLGRQGAADAAFAELLQAYPYSSYAPVAKKRLGQD